MRLEGKGSVYFSKPRLLSLSFSVRWLSLPRSRCFPRLSHPQSSNGEDVHGDNSAAFGRPRAMQVFKAHRSPEARLRVLLKAWESEKPADCGSSPRPSHFSLPPCSVSATFLSSSSLLPFPSVAISGLALGMLGNPPMSFS